MIFNSGNFPYFYKTLQNNFFQPCIHIQRNKLQPLPCKVSKNKQLKSAKHILLPATDDFESKQNNEISWCSSVLSKPLDSSVVLATCLGFASFKFYVVDPNARNSIYFFFFV